MAHSPFGRYPARFTCLHPPSGGRPALSFFADSQDNDKKPTEAMNQKALRCFFTMHLTPIREQIIILTANQYS